MTKHNVHVYNNNTTSFYIYKYYCTYINKIKIPSFCIHKKSQVHKQIILVF